VKGTDQADRPPVDWAVANRLARECGPRTLGLVEVRNLDALTTWLPTVAAATRKYLPAAADRYLSLAVVLGVVPPKFVVDGRGEVSLAPVTS
jgi:hypothetical protein